MFRPDRLTMEEADAARRIVEKHGPIEARRLLGICSEMALAKAIARLAVSTLTTATIRARLRDIEVVA
jgi:hypothetical protein